MTFTASAIFKCPFPGASTFTPSCGRHRRPSLEFFPSSQTQLRPHQTRAAAPPPRRHLGPGAGRIARCVAFCDWLSHSAHCP